MGKRKEFAYKYQKGEGDIKELKIRGGMSSNGFNNANCALTMCPYTEFVPLLYVIASSGLSYNPTISFSGMRNERVVKIAKSQAYRSNLAPVYTQALYVEKKLARMRAFSEIDILLKMDEPISLSGVLASNYTGRISSVENKALLTTGYGNDYSIGGVEMNSWAGAVSPLSLYLGNDNAPERWNRRVTHYFPHILAVIMPEHIEEVRLSYFTHGIIPLERVVVLVSKEIENTQFEIPAFRAAAKRVLGEIKTTVCDRWIVPQSFMMEKCFIPPFSLKSRNILQRVEEEKELIEDFKSWMAHKNTPTSPPEMGGIDDILMINSTGATMWEGLASRLSSGGAGINHSYTYTIPYEGTSISQMGGDIAVEEGVDIGF